MSVTRYFNQPAPAVATHVAAQVPSLNDPVNQSSGDQSGDNFHPFNPRFEVGFDSSPIFQWLFHGIKVFP